MVANRNGVGQIESGNLVLDPAYQREVVWDENRASLLITSVLSRVLIPLSFLLAKLITHIVNYFIPPVLFNLKPKIRMVGGQKKTYIERTCVDGKQRLTSIWRFMKGQLGFFDTSHPAKKWYVTVSFDSWCLQVLALTLICTGIFAIQLSTE